MLFHYELREKFYSEILCAIELRVQEIDVKLKSTIQLKKQLEAPMGGPHYSEELPLEGKSLSGVHKQEDEECVPTGNIAPVVENRRKKVTQVKYS